MRMETVKRGGYIRPEIEILTIVVEQGFVGSTGQLPEYEEDDDVIVLG